MSSPSFQTQLNTRCCIFRKRKAVPLVSLSRSRTRFSFFLNLSSVYGLSCTHIRLGDPTGKILLASDMVNQLDGVTRAHYQQDGPAFFEQTGMT